jgi:hypothetical protein
VTTHMCSNRREELSHDESEFDDVNISRCVLVIASYFMTYFVILLRLGDFIRKFCEFCLLKVINDT